VSSDKKQGEPVGLDLVDGTPDYTKSAEEDQRIYRERFFKVYGRYPGEPSSKDSSERPQPLSR
jgi:hypothetical protein